MNTRKQEPKRKKATTNEDRPEELIADVAYSVGHETQRLDADAGRAGAARLGRRRVGQFQTRADDVDVRDLPRRQLCVVCLFCLVFLSVIIGTRGGKIETKKIDRNLNRAPHLTDRNGTVPVALIGARRYR